MKPQSLGTRRTRRARKQRGFGWPTVIGIAITIPLVWWSLQGVHIDQMLVQFRRARVVPFLAAMLLVTAAIPIRVLRWRRLLESDRATLRFAPLFHATAIGFMANNVLPARAGELARAYAARRLAGARFSTALTTIVVSRVLDGVTLFALLALATLMGWFSRDVVVSGVPVGRILTVAMIAFGALFVTALIAVHVPNLATGAVSGIARAVLPRRWGDRAVAGVEGILHGMNVLRSWRRFGVVLGWSLVVWGLNGAAVLLCFVAFDLDVPWHAAVVLQSLLNFGLVIPSTPGFVGVFEGLIRAILTVYGVEPNAAVSYALAYHFCTYVPVTLLGFWSLSRAHLHLSDIEDGVADRVSVVVHRVTGRMDQREI